MYTEVQEIAVLFYKNRKPNHLLHSKQCVTTDNHLYNLMPIVPDYLWSRYYLRQ